MREDTDRKQDLVSFIEKLPTYSPPSGDEYRKLCADARAGDPAARARLTELNLRFVASWALRYKGPAAFTATDRFQAAVVGMLESTGRYDPDNDSGAAFTTYATWHMLKTVAKEARVSYGDSIIKFPTDVWKILKEIGRVVANCLTSRGRMPTDEELIRETGLKQCEIDRVLGASIHAPLDLYYSVTDGEGECGLHERVCATAPDPEEIILWKERTAALPKAIEEALATLSDTERFIIEGRNRTPKRTLEEIGDELGYSRERVRQFETIAKAKLRNALRDWADEAA